MKNMVGYSKEKTYLDGSKFEIKYVGLSSDSSTLDEKTYKLLEQFMGEYVKHDIMVDNIKFLRTILKDYEEKLLTVSYKNSELTEKVHYEKTNLLRFEKSINDKDSSMIFKYGDNKREIKSYNISDADFVDKYNDLMIEFHTLKDVDSIGLSYDAETIITVYKKFYDEDLDFTNDKSIETKIQTMVYILMRYGISVLDCNFIFVGERKVPYSANLGSIVKELYPFGKISEIDKTIKLSKEAEKKIKAIGREVRNATKDDKKMTDILLNICRGIYTINSYQYPDEVATITNYQREGLYQGIQLTRKIDDRLKQLG